MASKHVISLSWLNLSFNITVDIGEPLRIINNVISHVVDVHFWLDVPVLAWASRASGSKVDEELGLVRFVAMCSAAGFESRVETSLNRHFIPVILLNLLLSAASIWLDMEGRGSSSGLGSCNRSWSLSTCSWSRCRSSGDRSPASEQVVDGISRHLTRKHAALFGDSNADTVLLKI